MRRVLHPVVIGGTARHRHGAHRGNAWLTPAWFVEEIRTAFGGRIDLDPCTEPSNPAAARKFYTAQDDGLKKVWKGRVWVNPPYSPSEPWIDKAIASANAGAQVYMLLPVFRANAMTFVLDDRARIGDADVLPRLRPYLLIAHEHATTSAVIADGV